MLLSMCLAENCFGLLCDGMIVQHHPDLGLLWNQLLGLDLQLGLVVVLLLVD